MKACVIQPPYSMEISLSDEYFERKLEYFRQYGDSMDIIVLSVCPSTTTFPVPL